MTAPNISISEGGCVIRGMVEMRRRAAHARCRIKAWRLTHSQAIALCDEIAAEFGPSTFDLYKSMCAGNATVLGAGVQVR